MTEEPSATKKEEPSGVVVIDKPTGLTSHDVVGKVRRALGTRRVGHAGTLDPMATGVLVVLVGEATKLAPFLTAHEKVYAAGIAFGRETSTLDREGETVAEHPIPRWLEDELAALSRGEDARGRLGEALDVERRRTQQVPPRVSAIQVDGERSYDRARRGEDFELAPRPVRLIDASIMGASAEPPVLEIRLEVSKGFYIRSLARDLGSTLGVGAHLAELRRLKSGPFAIEEASALDSDLRARLLGVSAAAARSLPVARLGAVNAARARQGKALREEDFEAPPSDGPSAWMSLDGGLIAVGSRSEDGSFRVVRGFN